MKKSYLRNVVNESYLQTNNGSIGDELYKLYADLSPNAKTKSGARVSDILRDILNELTEVVHHAKGNTDQPETIHSLLKALSID